jgi:hypothetical protein
VTETYTNDSESITIDTTEHDVENCLKIIETNVDTIQETLFQAIFVLSKRDNWESSKEIKYEKNTYLFKFKKKLRNRMLKTQKLKKVEGQKLEILKDRKLKRSKHGKLSNFRKVER